MSKLSLSISLQINTNQKENEIEKDRAGKKPHIIDCHYNALEEKANLKKTKKQKKTAEKY